MLLIIERFSLLFAILLALLAVGMSIGPSGRQWTSNYLERAFAPAIADLGAIATVRH